MHCALFIAVLTLTVGTASAILGLDASTPISQGQFECLYKNNFHFYNGPIQFEDGSYSLSGINNIKNARMAGLDYVDGAIEPCHDSTICIPLNNQVEAAIRLLKAGDAQIRVLWLIVLRSSGWSTNLAINRNIILAMTSKAESLGFKVGIYTTSYDWKTIVGLNWAGVSKYPLLWLSFDGKANLDDFKPFGGWSKPLIKKYYEQHYYGPCGVRPVYYNVANETTIAI